MADQTLGDHRAMFGEPVLQVRSDGVIPVDVARPWATGSCRSGESPAHCLTRLVDQTRFDVGKHLRDHLACGCASLVRQHRIQLDEQRHHMNVGLDRLQQLGFEEQLLQVESLDRVALYDLHHWGREIRANIAEPSHHARFRSSQPTGPFAATSFATRTSIRARIVSVIQGSKGCIDSFVVTTECWR